MPTLSDEIRRAIDSCGLTRYRLAQETGLPQSLLSKFMSGKAIRTEAVDRIAKVLGLELKMKLPPATKRLVAAARRQRAVRKSR